MAISKTSIHDLTLKAARDIRKSLKARGIEVSDVEGGSTDQPELRGLQELQQIQRALDEADEADAARNSSVGTTSASAPGSTGGARTEGVVGETGLKVSTSSVDAGSPSTGKK